MDDAFCLCWFGSIDLVAVDCRRCATVADLRSGTLKLRDEWRGCEARLGGVMSGAAAAAGRAADAEQRRQASAGAIVRAADECDAQVTALQARVNLDARLCGVAR